MLVYALQVVAQETLWLAKGVEMKDGDPEAEAEEAVAHALCVLGPEVGTSTPLQNVDTDEDAAGPNEGGARAAGVGTSGVYLSW